MDKLPITKAGELMLVEKLHLLKTKNRPEISQAIAEARSHGRVRAHRPRGLGRRPRQGVGRDRRRDPEREAPLQPEGP